MTPGEAGNPWGVSSQLVLAHAGHWLEAALFVPPTVLVLAATVRTLRHGRGRDGRRGPHTRREDP